MVDSTDCEQPLGLSHEAAVMDARPSVLSHRDLQSGCWSHNYFAHNIYVYIYIYILGYNKNFRPSMT